MLGAMNVHAVHRRGNEGVTAKSGLLPAREPRMRRWATSDAPPLAVQWAREARVGPSARARARTRARAVFPRLGSICWKFRLTLQLQSTAAAVFPKNRTDLLEVQTHAPTPVNSSSSLPKNRTDLLDPLARPQLGWDRIPPTRDLGARTPKLQRGARLTWNITANFQLQAAPTW